MNDDPLTSAVAAARADARVRPAVHGIYEQLAAATEQRRPRCDRSGNCCRFDAFGHRLFVSTAELAVFVGDLTPRDAIDDPGGCAFQIGGACSVHAIRPLGCRMFFCDPSAELWQQDRYAELHGQMRRLHADFGLAYHYVEWREALRRLGLVSPARASRSLPVLSTTADSL